MRSRLLLAGLVLTLPLTISFAEDKKENSAAVPAKKDANRHERFLKDIKDMGTVDVVFLGDSITDGWRGQGGRDVWKQHFTPLKAVNLGIGGDRTQHVLWRLQNGELDGYKPKAFVVMIGTNNMGSNSEEEIASGVKAILDEIHKKHADAKILLLGIFPRSPAPTDKIRDKVKKTNELLAKFDDGKTVQYLDIVQNSWSPMAACPRKLCPISCTCQQRATASGPMRFRSRWKKC